MRLLKSPKTLATIHAFLYVVLLQFQLGVSYFSGFLICPDYIRDSDINAVELVLLYYVWIILCVFYFSNRSHHDVSYVINYFYNYFWFRNVTLMDADRIKDTCCFPKLSLKFMFCT